MPFLLKHWRYIAVVAVVAAVLVWWNADVKKAYEKGRVDMVAELSGRLKDAAIEKAKTDREQSAKYQAARAEREQKERTRYVEVQKIVTRPVYRNVCLDDDGVQVVNAAIADGN